MGGKVASKKRGFNMEIMQALSLPKKSNDQAGGAFRLGK